MSDKKLELGRKLGLTRILKLTKNFAEKRRSIRWGQLLDLFHVEIPDHDINKIYVVDISYGGVQLPYDPIFQELAQRGQILELKLGFHDKAVLAKARIVRLGEESIGLAFVHRDDSVLIFLRPYLEYMKIGSSLTKLDRYKFQGDEGLQVALRKTISGGVMLDQIRMNFAGSDYDVSFSDDVVLATGPGGPVKAGDAFFYSLLGLLLGIWQTEKIRDVEIAVSQVFFCMVEHQGDHPGRAVSS